MYIPVKITIPIAPYQNGIPNNSDTTIPPAYIVTDTFVITYANKENIDKNPSDNTTVPMLLTMMNSNTNGLVRTAAIPKWIMYDDNLKDSDYVYEHTQTASDTIVELMRAIYNSKNNSELLSMFDTIMANFDVAILPKSKDALVNKDFKQNARRKGGVSKKSYEVEIEYPSEGGLPIRYEDANKLRGAGIKLEPLSTFKKSKTQPGSPSLFPVSPRFSKFIPRFSPVLQLYSLVLPGVLPGYSWLTSFIFYYTRPRAPTLFPGSPSILLITPSRTTIKK